MEFVFLVESTGMENRDIFHEITTAHLKDVPNSGATKLSPQIAIVGTPLARGNELYLSITSSTTKNNNNNYYSNGQSTRFLDARG